MSIFFIIRYISNQTNNKSALGAKGQKLAKKMKGDEGWAFTIHPRMPCVYRHFRRKDEGWRVTSHSCFRKKIRYKDFSKNLSPVSLYKTTTNISYKKEIREQNAKQIFLSHQVCNVPKEGHFCAEVRALLCSGKSTFVPPRNAMVRK